MQILGYKIAAIAIIATFSSLGTFVYLRNPQSRLHRDCFFFSLFVSLWTFGFLLTMFSSVDHTTALLFSRLSHVFGVMIPVVFLKFALSLIGMEGQRKRFLELNYIITAALAIGYLTSPLFIQDVQPKLNFPYYPVAGHLYIVFIIYWLSLASYAHYLLFLDFKQNSGHRREQIKYFFLGQIIAWGGAFLLFPLIYGINIDPVSYVLLPIYSILTTYAIVKHQLLDIEVVIRKTAVFAGLFAFIYGTFTIITVFGKEFFTQTLGWSDWAAMVPTAFIVTFALRPLESSLTNATETFLFQKKYDYRELLRTFTNEILTVLDLQRLADQTVAGLVRIIKLESASIYLFNKEKKIYELLATQGVRERILTLDQNSAIVEALKASSQHILKDKSVDKMEERSELHNTFKKLNAQLCLPIELHDELVGMLFLGMKKSGEDYTQEDIDILTTLSRTEAIAISNARLFDELSKTQAEAAQREKMAVIGTLAAGINHEICNPLGIVRGQCEMFLLNQRDGFYDGKNAEELLKISSDIMTKVIKETDRATGITKKLSSFAKPSKRNEFEAVQVDKEVDEVLGLVNHDLSLNNIKVEKSFVADFPLILADKKQVQEVLFNIIRNAAQAMDKKAGQITVSGSSLNGSAIVKIADNGSGIPEDKIGQIFNPFYTTKAPGKGTGLGLFIVKQVVERNKGTIAVESVAGQGTTFTLTFPAHKAELASALRASQ